MVKSIDSSEAIKAIEGRADAARVTLEALCERAKVHYSSFYRGRNGRLTVKTLDKLETTMAAIEAERAAS